MDRRLFLTGLLGVAGTAAFASALPREAEALTSAPENLDYLRPDFLPETDEAAAEPAEEGTQVAANGGHWRRPRRHRGHYRRSHRRHYRRRRRYRHWRRNCWWRYGRRICRRRAVWLWGFF
jgi:hypothetical protein